MGSMVKKIADYARFFRDEKTEQEFASAHALREAGDWLDCSYHKKFLAWLEAEASRPMAVSAPHAELIQAAVRANTYREILAHLARVDREVRAAVQQIREESNA